MLSIPYQQQLKAIAKINPAIGAAINTAELVGPLVGALVKAVGSQRANNQIARNNPGSASSNNFGGGARKARQKRGKNVQGLNVVVAGGNSGAVNALQGSASFNYNRMTDRMTISHTEILSVISLGAGGDGRQIIPVNCSLTNWLETESQRFGRWRPKSISLKYLPNCSTNITGTIVIAPFHDPLSDNEMKNAGYNSLMSTSGAVSGSLWSNTIPVMKWDCSTLNNEWFEVPELGPDHAIQSLGDMYIMATSDVGGLLGRIQISYTIEFAYNRMELVADQAAKFSLKTQIKQRKMSRGIAINDAVIDQFLAGEISHLPSPVPTPPAHSTSGSRRNSQDHGSSSKAGNEKENA
jgi:hypothetical protein